MLLGLAHASAGEIELLGRPMPAAAADVLPRVGALVEGPAFQPYLTGRANLRRLDAVDASADPRTSRTRIESALERVGLQAAANKLYRQYSLGMKQRLGLAAALLQPRDLLILDEPTNGLDPQGTREVRRLIRDVAQEGTTVLVSSHLLSEIDQVCTHLGVMSRGRLLVQGDRESVAGSERIRVELTTRPDQLERARATLERMGLVVEDVADRTVTARLVDAALADVAPALVAADVEVLGLHSRRPTLEDTFVELTGEGFDVAE